MLRVPNCQERFKIRVLALKLRHVVVGANPDTQQNSRNERLVLQQPFNKSL